jgi:predicted RNase H-like HicB family nuclease
MKQKVNITGVLVQDEKTGGFTSYFAELPEVIAEGDTEDEAIKHLFEALQSVLEFRKEEAK